MFKIFLISISFIFVACNKSEKVETAESNYSDTDEDETETGMFEISGVKHECKISKQYIGSDKLSSNYSIVCQQDEPLIFLQVTFANEKEARSGANLVLEGGSYKVNPGTFSLEVSGVMPNKQHVAKSSADATLKSGNNVIEINNFKLSNSENDEIILNAKIPY